MKSLSLLIFFILFSSALSYGMAPQRPLPELPTVSNVDLDRYLGKWYEIARKPQVYEKNCVGVIADYGLRSNGKISVRNSCRKHTCEGKISVAKGVARVVDSANHSKLKVSFFWPFEGDYWILELDPEYSYAVVGAPDRKSFWILSRSQVFPEFLLDSIKSRFGQLGFDLADLEITTGCDEGK